MTPHEFVAFILLSVAAMILGESIPPKPKGYIVMAMGFIALLVAIWGFVGGRL